MSQLVVLPRGQSLPRTPRPKAPTVRLGSIDKRPAFAAPVTDPGAREGLEIWRATSADGKWQFVRGDDRGQWQIEFIPTGQLVSGTFGTLLRCRQIAAAEQTVIGLIRATADLIGSADARDRLRGHRYYAIMSRIGGYYASDYRCQCGGILVDAGVGRLVHVDGCVECFGHDQGFLPGACVTPERHAFCADPAPALCGHSPRNSCRAYALPNAGASCGAGGTGDCCTGCCRGE